LSNRSSFGCDALQVVALATATDGVLYIGGRLDNGTGWVGAFEFP
jgi:hypothetical protein